MQKPKPVYITLPRLEKQWNKNQSKTIDDFQKLITYHVNNKQYLSAIVYRCALVQLINGHDLRKLEGLKFTEERLIREAGA